MTYLEGYTMPAYLIVNVDVNDPEAYAEYKMRHRVATTDAVAVDRIA